jgi:peptidase E
MSGAIVAMGCGCFSEEPDNPLLDGVAVSLARRERPRVCFVATASGDAEGYVRASTGPSPSTSAAHRTSGSSTGE